MIIIIAIIAIVTISAIIVVLATAVAVISIRIIITRVVMSIISVRGSDLRQRRMAWGVSGLRILVWSRV